MYWLFVGFVFAIGLAALRRIVAIHPLRRMDGKDADR